MKNATQRGFTILELVVVIAIIGILAAVAIPRFLDLSERAHDAAVQGVQAALASSVAMTKAAWYATGRSGDLNNVVFAQGKQGDPAFGIDTNVNGWATGVDKTSAAGSTDNASFDGDADDCVDLWNAYLDTNAPKVSSDSLATFPTVDYVASSNANVCTWTYKADEDNDPIRKIEYDNTTGEVKAVDLWIDRNVESGGG